jgi:segregation and condensation protein A
LWQDRFVRRACDLESQVRDLAEEPVREIELWDLVSAFGRVMRDSEAARPACIVYDETPVQVFMQRIHAQLRERGRLAFSELFQPQMHKSTLIGIFLALLELVRHHGVIAEQNDLFGEIWLLHAADADAPLDLGDVTDYEHPRGDAVATPSTRPR